MTRQRVTDRGNPRKYWTQVPNLVDESDLDPYARSLYLHYLRIAGQRETCEETVRTSANACHMSQASVLKARQKLVDEGWIEVEDLGTRGRGADQRIHLLDRWQENMARFGQSTQSENGNARVASISGGEGDQCSPDERNARQASNSAGNARVPGIPHCHASISNSPSFLTPEERRTGDEKTGEKRAGAREGPINGPDEKTSAEPERVDCGNCGKPGVLVIPPWSGLCGSCRRTLGPDAVAASARASPGSVTDKRIDLEPAAPAGGSARNGDPSG